jgi:hypothetical protein
MNKKVVDVREDYKLFRTKFIIGLIVVVILFFIFTSSKTSTVLEKHPIIVQEYNDSYYVNRTVIKQTPYVTQEFYYEEEGTGNPTCKSSPWSVEISTNSYFLKEQENTLRCEVKVKNLENESASWTLAVKFTYSESISSGPSSEEQVAEVVANGEVTLIYDYDKIAEGKINPKTCEAMIKESPVMEECFYTFTKKVKKIRNVTKYKNETIIQKVKSYGEPFNITKYVEVNVTKHFNKFFGYNQGFSLGY